MKKQNHTDHRKAYRVVWIALLILTVITVQVAYKNYGVFNILVAMGIATIKASLVCLYFMHLKYDNRVNQVIFISSFVFLGIFVGLTASDELFRPVESAAKVVAVEPPAASQTATMEKLRVSTPDLVAKGKQIYATQCATCHGTAGKGDGPAAAAFTPKPRDFTSGTWTQGGTPAQVFNTVTKGIEGTSMGAFGSLSVPDRWDLVHYIRSLSPNTPKDTPETLSLIGLGKAAAAGPAKPQPLPSLPVDFAIDRLVEESKEQ